MKICTQCRSLALRQFQAKEQEEIDWRDVYRMHLFFQHHNPPIFVGDVEKYELPNMPKEIKVK